MKVLIGVGLAAVSLVGSAASAMPQFAQFGSSLVSSAHELRVPGGCDRPMRRAIDKSGGAFAIPPCSGWVATIDYPPTGNGLDYHVGVTSSVTNNFGAPPPSSGTPILYIQMVDRARNSEPNFQMTGAQDTVTSPQLLASHWYTLTVYGLANTDQCVNTPCAPWTMNIGSPNPSTHSITFSSPLNGALFAGGAIGGTPIVWQFVQN